MVEAGAETVMETWRRKWMTVANIRHIWPKAKESTAKITAEEGKEEALKAPTAINEAEHEVGGSSQFWMVYGAVGPLKPFCWDWEGRERGKWVGRGELYAGVDDDSSDVIVVHSCH